MRRSAEIRDLSEEHHYGLVAAGALRLAGDRPVSEAVDAFLAEWRDSIQPHFQMEEALLLPKYAMVAGGDHALAVRTLTEHGALREEVYRLANANAEAPRPIAARIAQLLHDHIRFEERELFPAIEEALAGSTLQRLGQALKHSASEPDSCVCNTWFGDLQPWRSNEWPPSAMMAAGRKKKPRSRSLVVYGSSRRAASMVIGVSAVTATCSMSGS